MNRGKKSVEHKVVILGSGFAGLYAARKLRKAHIDITIVDRKNHHLFQPLLYQVATGALSPGDIASPVRGILHKFNKIKIVKANATGIDVIQKKLILENETLPYDTLVVATGMKNYYFGHDDWENKALGLKSLADAVENRGRIFEAGESAENERNKEKQKTFLTLAVIGAGPTGVEMAGAIAELAHHTLRNDFSSISPGQSRIMLIEGGDRLLPSFHEKLSEKAKKDLQTMGVEVLTQNMVKENNDDSLILQTPHGEDILRAATIIWAAGIKAVEFSEILRDSTGVELDKFNRIKVDGNLAIPGHPEILIAGDMACVTHRGGETVPMVAPAANQEGKYVAQLIRRRLKGKSLEDFKFFDKGSLAVIGRNKAVVEIAGKRFGGFFAWIIWIFIHITFLIGFDNKLLVLLQWSWTYFTKKRGSRLIIEE
ncbi:MAG: NAD(P)/FAD-dependent oxidoreductase [Spirochaetaceae bacterium]|jgi:NADH dehydrogenase|nr:NAD(P)/FAD-dependent oxidoreductase [Spirochaetaceae bacterium]